MRVTAPASTATTMVGEQVAALRNGKDTFGVLLERVAEFAVPAQAGALPTPLTAAARTMVTDSPGLLERLSRVADLVRESPAGRIDRLSLATEVADFHAARAAARIPLSGREAADDVLASWLSLRRGAIEGEYLPGSGHMLLGPLGSNGILNRFGPDVPGFVHDRSVYIVAHEVAHARRPVSSARLGEALVQATEEARADLVARWSDLPSRVQAATGMPFNPASLHGDATYSAERVVLEQKLAASGFQPGAPTAGFLDSIEATALLHLLG